MPKKGNKPNVVVIGGGTGTFVVLSGLKKYPVNLHAIVTMMDSGGSTGRLRDQLGVLPPGDLRQALVALSESSQIWRDLFTYRFDNGDLSGHNFGNLFLTALSKITGSVTSAVSLAESILNARGRVIPVTLDDVKLCAKLKNHTILEGEALIDVAEPGRSPIKYAFLKPEASPNLTAIKVIEQAVFIIVGPGDIYTSIIPNLLVNDIGSAVVGSRAAKVYITNLMTKLGQTEKFTALDHVNTLEKYLKKGVFDYVLINSVKPPKELITWYKKSSDTDFVKDDLKKTKKILRADLLSNTRYEQSLSDRIKRSLIRHDSEKLGKVLFNIISSIS